MAEAHEYFTNTSVARASSASVSVDVEALDTRNVVGMATPAPSDLEATTHYYYDPDYYYGEEYYEDDYYYEIFMKRKLKLYEILDFEYPVLGVVWPILVLLTSFANVFVIVYFLMRKNRGKPTNVLFVSIAISDTLTGVVTLPVTFHIFSTRRDLITQTWCTVAMVLRFYVSRVFHTVSVWQTLLLAIQRYMCVCHPFISGRWCTVKKTLALILVMYLAAPILHCYHLVDDKVGRRRCEWVVEKPCSGTCAYLWFTLIFFHLLPCCLLILLTVYTLLGLSEAKRRVISMAHGSASNRSVRDRQITITVTLIVIVFLIPELPQGIYKLVFVIGEHLQTESGAHNAVLTTLANHIIMCVYEVVLVISFHCNFWIYCVMMHDFRHALRRLVTCSRLSRGMTRLLSQSSRSSGSVRSMISRTSSIGSTRHRILSGTTSVHSTTENGHVILPLTPPIQNGSTHPFQGVGNGHTNAALTDTADTNDDVFI